jgi:PadR family transcriptional regulator PadR
MKPAMRSEGEERFAAYVAHELRSPLATQRALLELALTDPLLAVMNEGPAYGYEMTKRLRERGLVTVGEGSIYPLLGRLEREGLVETYRAASKGGPPRKYYSPSSAGRVALVLGVSEWRAARDAIDAVLASVKVEVAS